MEEVVAHQIVREDGFIEIEFHHLKDFDDYLFTQIQKDKSCLACIRDTKKENRFYFDTHNCICLTEYLSQHVFEEQEALLFLIHLFEAVIALARTKYITYKIDHIYLTNQYPNIRFLVLPISKDPWEHEESQISSFILECYEQIQIQSGYEVIGCLCVHWKQHIKSLGSLVTKLYEIKQRFIKRRPFLQRIRKKEETFIIKNLPEVKRYPSTSFLKSEEKDVVEEDTYKTVVLFSQDCYFECVLTKQQYEVTHKVFKIGRGTQNDLCMQNAEVSLYHASFEKETSLLKDLHSSNGTFVNNNRIDECVLRHLDHVSFAGREFIYYEK